MPTKQSENTSTKFHICPENHRISITNQKTYIVTRCEKCNKLLAFHPAEWVCPFCGEEERVGGDPFFVVQYCRRCKKWIIVAWRSDTDNVGTLFMSKAEQKEFFDFFKAGKHRAAVEHICGIVEMYEGQVNLEIMTQDPELEVEDIVYDF